MTTATTPDLEPAATEAFAAGIRGPVLRPGDDGYDDARAIWNGLIDRRPALIVQCTGAADVVDAVNFAREQGLLLSIKGGGHNVAGNAVNDGGLVIDLSRMRGVHVDPADADGARAGRRDLGRLRPRDAALRPGGARRRRLDDRHRRPDAARRRRPPAPQARALDRQPALGRHRHRRRPAAAGERDRERGPLLGGARRRQQLRRRHVVRVPGASGRPDGDGRRDLLPARGRAGAILAGLARLHGRGARRAQLARDLLERPAGRAVPARAPRRAGRASSPAVYAGPVEEGEAVVQPLRELAEPLIDLSGPWPWLGLQSGFDALFPKGGCYYWKSRALAELTDDGDRRDRRLRRPPAVAAHGHRRSGTTAAR